jgi:pyruvate dehydrogenase kinase 2/3/4
LCSNFIHHILFELLKNSMRAVVETHEGKRKTLPPIKIILSASPTAEDVVIKVRTQRRPVESNIIAFATVQVSDEGGGIPRSGMRR